MKRPNIGLLFFQDIPGHRKGVVSPEEAWAIRSAATTYSFLTHICVTGFSWGTRAHVTTSSMVAMAVFVLLVFWGIVHYRATGDTP